MFLAKFHVGPLIKRKLSTTMNLQQRVGVAGKAHNLGIIEGQDRLAIISEHLNR